MFEKFTDYIKQLNANVSDAANSEKAKNLRKKLLTWGTIAAVVGFGGVFVCFILFATAGFDAFGPGGFTPRVLIPFILFLPCGFIGAIGATLLRFGFSIVIAGAATKFIDKQNLRCSCGHTLKADENFCPACGKTAKLKCECGTLNDYTNKHCKNCGKQLK